MLARCLQSRWLEDAMNTLAAPFPFSPNDATSTLRSSSSGPTRTQVTTAPTSALPFTPAAPQHEMEPPSTPPHSASPFSTNETIDPDCLPSSLMPAALKSDPPPPAAPLPAWPTPTASPNHKRVFMLVAATTVGLNVLAALAILHTL